MLRFLGACGMSESAFQLARGDFAVLRKHLASAGLRVTEPCAGVLGVSCRHPNADRLLLSVGVHGDETLPVELLASRLDELAREPEGLAVDVMIVVANLRAIAAGMRFLQFDLNRLFRPEAPNDSAEGARAAELRDAVSVFFHGAESRRLHLDLHSTIKASLFSNFAVVPHLPGSAEAVWLAGWLGPAGIEAAIYSDLPSSTFSAFTARRCGAASATLELGRRGSLGSHSLAAVAPAATALHALLFQGFAMPMRYPPPHQFRAVREIVRRTDQFLLCLREDAPNFSAFEPNEVIARDGEEVHRALQPGERIVFPNAEVALGLRAGVIVAPLE